MSTPVPTPGAAPAPGFAYRAGDVVTNAGALVLLVSTALPYEKNDYGQLTVWHTDFLSAVFAIIIGVAAAVVGTVFGGRTAPLIGRLGLTAAATAAVASAVAVLFYAASLITFSQVSLATAGPVIGALGVAAVAVGSFGLAFAAPGSGLATKLGGAPKPVQANFGQFAPAGQQPGAVGYAGQPASHQGFAPGFDPDRAAQAAPPAPTPDAARFSPFWAGVTAPVPAFSPAEATSQIGEVTPGQWYLVTGQHPAGLLVDLRGRPVLVRDVDALVRG